MTNTQVQLSCGYCDAAFTRNSSKVKPTKSGLYFCSRKHQGLAYKKDSGIHVSSGPTSGKINESKSYYCINCEGELTKYSLFCSDACSKDYRNKLTEKTCSGCGKSKPISAFYKQQGNKKDGFNNKCITCLREAFVNRRKPCPKGCGATVSYLTKACRACHAKEKNRVANEKTLGRLAEANEGKRGRIHADSVRFLARVAYADILTSCKVCGYTEHVDICHVKDVKLFDLPAKIKEINAPDNVVALCKLHHWEYDNGYIFEELDSSWKPKTDRKATRMFFL